MTGYLVRAVLSSDCDLWQKAPAALLFCLAHYGGGQVSLTEKMQIGLAALKRWQQQCDDNSSRLPKWRLPGVVTIPDYNCSLYIFRDLDSVTEVMGLLQLTVLSVFLDKEPLVTGAMAKRMKFGAVDSLITAFAGDWIDPLLAFILLVEVTNFIIRRAMLWYWNESIYDGSNRLVGAQMNSGRLWFRQFLNLIRNPGPQMN